MAVFVNPASGERFENVPDDQVERAQVEFGLVPEAEYRLQEERGGFVDQLKTGAEEAGRRIASLAAPLKTFVGDPFASAETVAPDLFDTDALARREANPTAAAIGGQLPLVPAYLAGGAGVALAADVASGYAEEAVDAEIQQRKISGANVLRNGALNAVFTGGAFMVPVGARALLSGGEDVVRRGAKAVSSRVEALGAQAIERRAAEALETGAKALERVKAPKVANNPRAQREALETLVGAFEKRAPEVAADFETLLKTSPGKRFAGLQAMREGAADPTLAEALDGILKRPELWGRKVIAFGEDLAAARALQPTAGAGLEGWRAYGDALRKLGGKTEKVADTLDELAGMRAVDALADTVASKVGGSVARGIAGKAGDVAGGVAGGMIGGWPGAFIGREILGKGAGNFLEPIAERALAGAKGPLRANLVKAADFLKAAGEADRRLTARLMVDPAGAAKFLRVAGAPLSPFARFKGEHETQGQAFEASRAAVERYRKEPMALIGLIEEQLGDVDRESPTLSRGIIEQTVKVQRYLAEHLPPRRGVSVARPNGSPPTPLQMRQWALRFTAATDPESVMADARAGRLRREQVDTLKALWPQEYDDLRTAVIEAFSSGRSTPLSRQRVSRLFELDGSIEPALGSRVRAFVAQARAKQQPAQPQRAPGMTSRQSLQSQTNLAPGGMQAMHLGMKIGS